MNAIINSDSVIISASGMIISIIAVITPPPRDVELIKWVPFETLQIQYEVFILPSIHSMKTPEYTDEQEPINLTGKQRGRYFLLYLLISRWELDIGCAGMNTALWKWWCAASAAMHELLWHSLQEAAASLTETGVCMVLHDQHDVGLNVLISPC